MRLEKKIMLKKMTAFALAAIMVAGTGMALSKQELSAASENRVTFVKKAQKDEELPEGKAPTLVIKLEDRLNSGNIFYVETRNATWLVDEDGKVDPAMVTTTVSKNAKFDVSLQGSNNILRVKFTGGFKEDGTTELDEIPAGESIRINLRTKIEKGIATLYVDGNDTAVSSSPKAGEQFAYVDGKGVNVAVNREVPSFYEDGTLAEIRLEENYVGGFISETRMENGVPHVYFNLRLYDEDFEFTNLGAINIKPIKGFDGIDVDRIRLETKGRNEIEIFIPKSELENITEKGGFDITGIDVAAAVKDPFEGNLVLTLEGEVVDTVDLVLATIKTYTLDTTIKPTGKENRSGLVVGRRGEYRVDIKETIKDTLANGRELTFEVDRGFMYDVKTRNRTDAMNKFAEKIKLPNTLKISDVLLEDTKVIGFSVDVTSKTDNIDEYAVTFPVTAPLDLVELFDIERLPKNTKTETKNNEDKDEEGSKVNFGGGEDDEVKFKSTKETKEVKDEINLIISGRALANEKIVERVTGIITPLSIKTKELALKTGLKDQKGSDVIFTEKEAGMIKKGNIVIQFDNVDGLSFSKPPTVEVTSGDLRLGKGELIRSGRSITGISFEVTRASRNVASTITIEDILVTADRTVPEGDTGLLFSGDALMEQGNPVESNYYVRIGALNLDDQKAEDENKKLEEDKNKVKEINSVFTIGSQAYSINGENKLMDAVPFIDNGRTMMPVRYVADAFGIDGRNILFHQGIVTILVKDKIIQLKTGSNVLLMNGAQIPMDASTVVVEGRTYIPAVYLATALEAYTYFDDENKVVTFNNLKNPNPLVSGSTANTTPAPSNETEEKEEEGARNIEQEMKELSDSGMSFDDILKKVFGKK